VHANLVANALRHTQPGGQVRVDASPAAAGVQIVVRDDGDGIPAELLSRVFDRFVKGADSPGSGLGLAIVRDIVEAHGGAVTVASTPGAGTEVRLTLPAAGGD
jgi:two-component system sensor histidine kinase BaeS